VKAHVEHLFAPAQSASRESAGLCFSSHEVKRYSDTCLPCPIASNGCPRGRVRPNPYPARSAYFSISTGRSRMAVSSPASTAWSVSSPILFHCWAPEPSSTGKDAFRRESNRRRHYQSSLLGDATMTENSWSPMRGLCRRGTPKAITSDGRGPALFSARRKLGD
jgi:hypothetical protein